MRIGNIATGFAAVITLTGAIQAQTQDQTQDQSQDQGLTLPQAVWPLGGAELRLAGDAGGALFDTHSTQLAGYARAMPQIRRDYDSGLSLSLQSIFTLADPRAHGRYDADAVEALYAQAHTGLGVLSVGITDGAGYALAVGGPKADADMALDDPRINFVSAGNTALALRTAVGASSNYAKLVYTSPALFGLQLALSFTPSEGKQLPFLSAGPHVAGRQADFWDGAIRYEDDMGPVTLSGYVAASLARSEHKLPGQEGTSDLGFGVRADYPVSDTVTVSLGGSYRQSNAYGFDVNQSWQAGTTRAWHVSGGASYGDWNTSLEYGGATADAVAMLPRLHLNGWEAAISYRMSPSIQIGTGWQRRDDSLKDAVFVHLKLSTSQE